MAYTTINKSSLHFNTKLWTGDGSNGRGITGIGFSPSLVWIKQRDYSRDNHVYDAVRGATYALASNNADAQSTKATGLTAFGSDGFTVGDDAGVNANTGTYVSWNWKAGSSNTSVSASGSGDGYINSATYRANTTSGFSIVQYTGANSQISNTQHTKVTHGLGAKPDMVIIKETSGADDWVVHLGTKNDTHLHFNSTDGEDGGSYVGYWSASDSTHLKIGNDSKVNNNGDTYIAYLFKNVKGFSKFGSYTGNGNVDGAFVYTGFKPAVLIVKTNTTTGGWQIYDNKRNTSNPTSKFLVPSSNAAEASGSNDIDFLSNGFKTRTTANPGTTDGFIYMAFAEAPLVGSNNVPCTAR